MALTLTTCQDDPIQGQVFPRCIHMSTPDLGKKSIKTRLGAWSRLTYTLGGFFSPAFNLNYMTSHGDHKVVGT